MIYLDNAATTRVRDEAAAAAITAMQEDFANPSSTHSPGRRASGIITRARTDIAAAIGASPAEIIFTSGGTESNNWAIIAGAEAQKRYGRHIIVGQSEHEAVRKPANHLKTLGFDVTFLAPDKSGRVTAEAFADALREDTILASIMLVNNETGAINPVADFAAEIKRRKLKTLLHTDAVQGFCKLHIDAKSLGADMISLSGHKIHAMKGVGALYIRSGLRLSPFILGGSQEYSHRAGTEPVPAIASFGEAARLMRAERETNYAHAATLRALAIGELRAKLQFLRFITDDAGIDENQSPYILSFALPGYRSEVLMTCLEDAGICVSRSSACKKGARSHVLESMRLPPEVIDGALRISFSRDTTESDVRALAEALAQITEKLYRRK